MKYFGLISILFLLNCSTQSNSKLHRNPIDFKSEILFDTLQVMLHQRIFTPSNFERVVLDSNSFGFYLRTIPLKSHNEVVKYYDGTEKQNNGIYCAVIDQDIDALNLQQCADAVMRMRGEYLFAQQKFSAIHFNYVGDGKAHYFSSYANGDYSYKKFRKYMREVFSFANTRSLKDELIPVEKFEDIQVGDVFIQSGNPYGHAVIVMDVAFNKETNERAFLLAQSYMPAQETQILNNPIASDLSPWYCPTTDEIITPQWRFKRADLRRFKAN
ncbi:MAG: DUF4846 domain-containing protein [Bacteroidota bacterium]